MEQIAIASHADRSADRENREDTKQSPLNNPIYVQNNPPRYFPAAGGSALGAVVIPV